MAEYSDKTYYQEQLNKLTDKYILNVCLIDYSGNSTKWMMLNNDSIEVLIEFLESQKTKNIND